MSENNNTGYKDRMQEAVQLILEQAQSMGAKHDANSGLDAELSLIGGQLGQLIIMTALDVAEKQSKPQLETLNALLYWADDYMKFTVEMFAEAEDDASSCEGGSCGDGCSCKKS